MDEVRYDRETPVAGVIPCLMVADAAAAIAFWTQAFGAREVNRIMADDGRRILHSRLVVNGGQVIVNDAFPDYGQALQPADGCTIHLQVEDARAAWDRAIAAGCTVIMPMAKMFWGDLYGQMRDPQGIRWSIGGPAPADA